MDFFTQQERARKSTKFFIFLYIIAVFLIVISVYLVTCLIFNTTKTNGIDLWDTKILATSSITCLSIIVLSSIFKFSQLASGGKQVALDLGGRLLDTSTNNFSEKRLLNIVEEMAIASGTPVPDVYILENDDSINAFAAGNSISDAVIGITRGALENFNREELQGVIAHEFSHIINGDMRMNMKLIGFLFGILSLFIIGQIMLRISFYSGGRHSRNSDANKLAIIMITLGISLIAIGFIGSIMARLLQSAISRQREFLADASAVQFTRNKDGIANALKKIATIANGGKISSGNAPEAAHMFFANGASSFFGNVSKLFATHPDISKRIKAIDKNWNENIESNIKPNTTSNISLNLDQNNPQVVGFSSQKNNPIKSQDITDVDPDLNVAKEIIQKIPPFSKSLINNSSGSQLIIFALLLAQDINLKNEELKKLRKMTDEKSTNIITKIYDELNNSSSSQKIGIIDLCIPTLRKLSPKQYDNFIEISHALITSDREIDLFEFMLQKIIQRHLDIYFNIRSEAKIEIKNPKLIIREANILFSTMAGVGKKNIEQVNISYQAGKKYINKIYPNLSNIEILAPEKCSLEKINNSLENLEKSSEKLKHFIIKTCIEIIIADKITQDQEIELLRAISDAIDCQLPPIKI